MHIDQLYYLVEVAKNKSFTLTAERIFVSQPTLSESLKNLEKELGVTLFHRRHQGVLLTEVGETTVKTAIQVLSLIENLKDDVRISKEIKPLTGSMVLYTIPSLNHTILPEVLGRFYKINPEVIITVVEARLNEIVSEIEKGQGDLGLVITTTPMLNEDEDNTSISLIGLFLLKYQD